MTTKDAESTPRIAIVTGAYGTIGKVIAEGLAKPPGFEVVMVGRDSVQIQRAAEAVKNASGHPSVRARQKSMHSPRTGPAPCIFW